MELIGLSKLITGVLVRYHSNGLLEVLTDISIQFCNVDKEYVVSGN